MKNFQLNTSLRLTLLVCLSAALLALLCVVANRAENHARLPSKSRLFVLKAQKFHTCYAAFNSCIHRYPNSRAELSDFCTFWSLDCELLEDWKINWVDLESSDSMTVLASTNYYESIVILYCDGSVVITER
jgi:hypothetical protein